MSDVNFNKAFDKVFKKPVCQNCEVKEGHDYHTCPYKVEIYGEYASCNCCSECRRQCLLDI